MSYILIIDNRERGLIELLDKKGYQYEKKNLDIGDIQFIDVETKNPLIVIERKTLDDLSSSMKDGRYKEQKERIIHSLSPKVRKIYLIEGEWDETSNISNKSLKGMVINTMIRDNIQVKEVKNVEDTVLFIEEIILHIGMYYDIVRNEICLEDGREFNLLCKTGKKDNMNSLRCLENMLLQISGVSSKTVKIMMGDYKNMGEWMKEMIEKKERGEFIKYVENINTGKKKLGNKLALKIEYYLFGEGELDSNKNHKDNNKDNKKDNKNHNISLFS